MKLSDRQTDVASLMGLGKTDKEIARILGIAVNTVKCHKKIIFMKLQVERRGGVANALISLQNNQLYQSDLVNR